MKTFTIFKKIAVTTAMAATFSASVLAQSGPAAVPGAGMGMGPGAALMGPGARGMRGMPFDQNSVPGWALMTLEERTANQTKMLNAKTYDECKTLQTEQHAIMEGRAKEKGIILSVPRQNFCDIARARGYFQ